MKQIFTITLLWFTCTLFSQVTHSAVMNIAVENDPLIIVDNDGTFLFETPQTYPAIPTKPQLNWNDKGVTISEAGYIYQILIKDCIEIVQCVVYQKGEIVNYWTK